MESSHTVTVKNVGEKKKELAGLVSVFCVVQTVRVQYFTRRLRLDITYEVVGILVFNSPLKKRSFYGPE